VLPFVGEHEVDVPERERGQRPLGLRLHELAAQPGRIGFQPPHGGERDPQRDGLEGRDPRPPGDAARRGGQLGLRHPDALQQRVGVTDEHPRGVGEPHAAAGLLQQRHPGLALEHRELLGHGRGREPQRLGHRGDRPPLAQLAQQPEPVQVEHQ
jgi:hypothetical protein